MSIKRQLLFGGYWLAKKAGLLGLMNRGLDCANILTFHRVNDLDSEPLTIRIDVFERLMKVIRQEYNPISLQELLDRVRRKKSFEPNTVAITFDDGYKDNFTHAAPILKEYDLPATFFVTSGYIDTQRQFPWDKAVSVKYAMMTWDEVRELARMGFEIGGHTINHVNLGNAAIEAARDEILGCKEKIEKELGRRISAFAFPFGRASAIRPEVLEIVRSARFDCCCSVYGGKVTVESDLYDIQRVPTYPTVTEILMELDNFMTYYKGEMKVNFSLGRGVS
jgi:peptidoglycan/xylan/chitin deacetylase (PgdA/CDA1 family)